MCSCNFYNFTKFMLKIKKITVVAGHVFCTLANYYLFLITECS